MFFQVGVNMANFYNQTARQNQTGNIDKSITNCFVYDSRAVVVIRVIVYSVLMVASAIGNYVVIRLVKKEGRSRHSTSLYIANMAVCALYHTVVYMPRAITLFIRGYEWQVPGLAGVVLCKCIIFLDYLVVSTWVLTVMIISVERCVVVAFPYKAIFITNRFSKVMVASTWLIALFTQWPFFYATDLRVYHGLNLCYIDHNQTFGKGAAQTYYSFNIIVMYAIPLAITTVSYAIIVVKLKTTKTPGDCLAASTRERQNRQIVYMVLTVVTLFVICWFLYFIFLVFYAYKIRVPCVCEFLFARLFLAHLNCAITPYLYTKFSARYRRAFTAIVAPICFCFCKNQLSNLEDRSKTSSHKMRSLMREAHTKPEELSPIRCTRH